MGVRWPAGQSTGEIVGKTGDGAAHPVAATPDAGSGYWRAMAALPPRKTYFWILPVAVFGSSSTV
jgi:hypothetical protein